MTPVAVTTTTDISEHNTANNAHEAVSTQPKVSFHLCTGHALLTPLEGIPQEVEVNGETPSLGTVSNNPAEWFESIRQKSRLGSEAMLSCDLVAYVRKELFSKLKFFMDPRQLMFSTNTNTICFQICKDMRLREQRAPQWWELYKNKIVQTLNSKRADVTSCIKRVFMSK